MSASDTEVVLPSELWLHIFSFLDYDDLTRCAQVNSQFSEVTNHKSLWQKLCRRYWLVSDCSPEITWKQLFRYWFKDFGKYINHYKIIKIAWDQIISYMEKHCSQIFWSIKSGLSEEEIDLIEEKLGYKLPLDLRCSYRLHNGQRLICPGLMGSMEIASHYKSESLLDFDTSLAGFRDGCLPLTICVISGVSQYITLSEEKGLPLHHIFYSAQNEPKSERPAAFLCAKNFTAWFSDYAEGLQNNEFPLIRGQPYRLSMPEDAPKSESCQLERRCWVITEEDGYRATVEGPGVVGEYPIMKPGATFSWISCTSFRTPIGSMYGHFTMRLLKSGDMINVACPIFHMISLPYLILPEKNQFENKRLKRNNSPAIDQGND